MWAELGRVTYREAKLQAAYAALEMPRSLKEVKVIIDEKETLQKRRAELNKRVANFVCERRKRRQEQEKFCSFCRVPLSSNRAR